MIIQQVYLKELGYSLYIKGIIPDEENPATGVLIFNGNPVELERQERYVIKNEVMVTENYTIPMPFIINFLVSNDCVVKNEKGETQVVLKEVLFKNTQLGKG